MDVGVSWTLSRDESVSVAGVGAGLVSSGIRLVAMSPTFRYPPIFTRDDVRLSVMMWTKVAHVCQGLPKPSHCGSTFALALGSASFGGSEGIVGGSAVPRDCVVVAPRVPSRGTE